MVTRRLANASKLATHSYITMEKDTNSVTFQDSWPLALTLPVVWSTAAGISPLHHHSNTGGRGRKTTGRTAAGSTGTETIMHCWRRGRGGVSSAFVSLSVCEERCCHLLSTYVLIRTTSLLRPTQTSMLRNVLCDTNKKQMIWCRNPYDYTHCTMMFFYLFHIFIRLNLNQTWH